MPPSEPLLAWHEQVEHTLLLWRSGRRLARRYLRSPQGHVYIRAVADALTGLQRYTTMEALVTAYGRTVRNSRRLPFQEGISQGMIEDVSYWLRLQQLVGRERQIRRAG